MHLALFRCNTRLTNQIGELFTQCMHVSFYYTVVTLLSHCGIAAAPLNKLPGQPGNVCSASTLMLKKCLLLYFSICQMDTFRGSAWLSLDAEQHFLSFLFCRRSAWPPQKPPAAAGKHKVCPTLLFAD